MVDDINKLTKIVEKKSHNRRISEEIRRVGRNRIVPRDARFDNSKFYIEFGIDIDKRKIFLDDYIDSYSIGWITRGIQEMIHQNYEKPIDIYINSIGGNIEDGLMLYDELEKLSYLTVKTHAKGIVASMAFILYMVGDERYCNKRARFMHHAGQMYARGKPFAVDIEVNEFKHLEDECDTIVAERTGYKNKTWWKKLIKTDDKFFGKEKAKQYGVVTHFYDSENES